MIYSLPFLSYFIMIIIVAGMGTINRELVPKNTMWIYFGVLTSMVICWCLLKLRR